MSRPMLNQEQRIRQRSAWFQEAAWLGNVMLRQARHHRWLGKRDLAWQREQDLLSLTISSNSMSIAADHTPQRELGEGQDHLLRPHALKFRRLTFRSRDSI